MRPSAPAAISASPLWAWDPSRSPAACVPGRIVPQTVAGSGLASAFEGEGEGRTMRLSPQPPEAPWVPLAELRPQTQTRLCCLPSSCEPAESALPLHGQDPLHDHRGAHHQGERWLLGAPCVGRMLGNTQNRRAVCIGSALERAEGLGRPCARPEGSRLGQGECKPVREVTVRHCAGHAGTRSTVRSGLEGAETSQDFVGFQAGHRGGLVTMVESNEEAKQSWSAVGRLGWGRNQGRWCVPRDPNS